jgi:polyisoprenoid-binding protein YceI
MWKFDASSAEILIYTYKEGLLSAVAHDLRLRAERFALEVHADDEGKPSRLTLSVDPRSIRMVCAMKNGADNPGALKPDDFRQIEDNIAKDVLEPHRYPTISFEARELIDLGDARRFQVRGELSLHGKKRPVWAAIESEQNALVAEVTLQQPDYGIKPFSALLGAMKIKPEVKVRVRVPRP